MTNVTSRHSMRMTVDKARSARTINRRPAASDVMIVQIRICTFQLVDYATQYEGNVINDPNIHIRTLQPVGYATQ